MPVSRRGPTGHRGTAVAAMVSVALLFLVVLPVGSLAAPSAQPSGTLAPTQTSGGITVTVTWNNANIQTASTESSAFQISLNAAVNVRYTWTSTSYSINDQRLQMFYFGFALATRDVTETAGTASGSVPLNWTTGPLEYVISGVYQLTASLVSPNGSTAWSESFWVDVQAPFYIGAVLPIVLILITVYELYSLATVGRQAALKARAKGGTMAPATSAPPSSPPPMDTGAAEGAPPGTPPPGGST